MGRTNKVTSGVFVDLIGNTKQISEFDAFLKSDVEHPSDELKIYTQEYQTIFNRTKKTIFKLSKLEEIILQLRSRDSLLDDLIKLSIVREYIYARIPFFRRERGTKDIRIIAGLTEFYGDNMEKLLTNKEFMDKAKEKLIEAMNNEIDYNKKEYSRIP